MITQDTLENANLNLKFYIAQRDIPPYPSRVIGGELFTQPDIRLGTAQRVYDLVRSLHHSISSREVATTLLLDPRQALVALRDLVGARLVGQYSDVFMVVTGR